MAGLVRLTSVWEGFPGAPGYTNFYARHNGVSAQEVADQFASDIHDFWTSLDGYFPADVTITVSPTWQSLDEANGQIQSEGTLESPPGGVTGRSVANYAGNAGVAIDWHTQTFIAGHRLRGRTFLVPFTDCFASDGTLDALGRQAIANAALALWDNSSIMVVWHRPVGGAGGSSAQITSATVTDRTAILRSRSV